MHRVFLSILIVLGLVILGVYSQATPPSQVEANKAAFHRYSEEIWNKGNIDLVAELVSPNYVRHSQATADQYLGQEGIRRYHEATKRTFPDYHQEVTAMVAEGDKVAACGTATGTQRGPWGPYPPSNKKMTLDFCGIHRFKDGKLVETWVTWNNLEVLTQLGHFSLPEKASE